MFTLHFHVNYILEEKINANLYVNNSLLFVKDCKYIMEKFHKVLF